MSVLIQLERSRLSQSRDGSGGGINKTRSNTLVAFLLFLSILSPLSASGGMLLVSRFLKSGSFVGGLNPRGDFP